VRYVKYPSVGVQCASVDNESSMVQLCKQSTISASVSSHLDSRSRAA